MNIIGHEILLNQLYSLDEDEKVTNYPVSKDIKKSFRIPEHLFQAFNSYYLDYMVPGESVSQQAGDIYLSIMDKITYFYEPIIDFLTSEDMNGLDYQLVVQPIYDRPSTVAVFVKNVYLTKKVIPYSAVILEENMNVWDAFFRDNEPETVCSQLAERYHYMKTRLQKLRSISNIYRTVKAEAEKFDSVL